MDSTWEYLSSEWYSNSRALAAFIAADGTAVDLGDCDSISSAYGTSNIDRFRKNTTTRVLGKRVPNQMDLTVSLTLTQLNPTMMAAQFVGKDGQYFEQEAGSGTLTHTIANYQPGRIALLPNLVLNATITGVKMGAVEVDPEDFRFDKMSGTLQVSSSSGIAAGTLEIKYTVPAVLAATKRVYTGIGQGGGVRGGLLVRQVNPYGPRKLVRYSPGLFMPTNANLIGGDEFDTAEFTFSPEADSTAPTGFELGWVRDISETVLAI